MKKITLFIFAISLISCYGIKSRKLNKQAEELAEKQKETAEKYKDIKPKIITYEQTLDSNTIFDIVEKMPEFPGGEEALNKFLAENINYPSKAKKKGTEGTVYTQFVIEADGSISDEKILRGIGDGCDEETIRVVQLMPNWTPGAQRGKPVRVRYNLPVKFKLTD